MAEENVNTYTFEEIAEHDQNESAWIVIQNNVYDVTQFLEEHPGGADIILDWAGREDATDAFEAAGHSYDARQQMKAFKIGEIVEDDRIAKEICDHELYAKSRLGFLIPVGLALAGILIYSLIKMRSR